MTLDLRLSRILGTFSVSPNTEDRFGNVQIPRGTRRTALAKSDVGLLGKIEFKSDWSAEKMRREVCCVFAKPFGLTKEDIEEGRLFPFDYLQRTGAGSRSLCTPAVTDSFEWNGRQVATLSKSGGYIYILARRALPVLASKAQMCFLVLYMSRHSSIWFCL